MRENSVDILVQTGKSIRSRCWFVGFFLILTQLTIVETSIEIISIDNHEIRFDLNGFSGFDGFANVSEKRLQILLLLLTNKYCESGKMSSNENSIMNWLKECTDWNLLSFCHNQHCEGHQTNRNRQTAEHFPVEFAQETGRENEDESRMKAVKTFYSQRINRKWLIWLSCRRCSACFRFDWNSKHLTCPLSMCIIHRLFRASRRLLWVIVQIMTQIDYYHIIIATTIAIKCVCVRCIATHTEITTS